MKTYNISLWIEDSSTGETGYKSVTVKCNPLRLEDAIKEKVEALPTHLTCSGWSHECPPTPPRWQAGSLPILTNHNHKRRPSQ